MKQNYSENCQKAFDKMKKILKSDLLLVQFDPAAEIVVASDVSEYGTGTAMLYKYKDYNMKAILWYQ